MFFTNNEDTIKYLMEIIYQKRENMLNAAKVYGLASKKTLVCSQELDVFITKYQKFINRDKAAKVTTGRRTIH